MKFVKTLLISVLIILIITYPASPVFFTAFFNNTHEFYFIYLILILVLSLNEISYSYRKNHFHDSGLKRSLILLFFVPIITFTVTGNSTALRDVSTILVFTVVFFFTKKSFKHKLIQNVLISYSVFVFLSILVLLFYIPNHYTGDIWRVTKELVNVKNPIYLRNYQGDFNYYFPYFLSVVPIDERLGIETRFPILFTESTYYFYFTLPFLGLAIVDKNLKYRVFILTILTIGLILSRSILGIFAILIAFIFSLFKNPKKNNGLIFKVLTTLLFALFIYYSCIYLDNLFSTNKSEELDIYTSDAAIELIKSNVSMFGLNFEPEEFKVYGSVIILFRYGILGVISIIFFIFALVRLLFRLRESHNNKILTFGFALIFLTSPFFSLKVPNLLNYASLIVVASFLDIYKLSNKSE